MIFHKSTYQDIQKYYPDNIVKFKETGDRLWQIRSINPDEIRCSDTDGFEIYLDLNEPYEVDFALPGRVVYQNGSYACMLARMPAKQYNRGIHSQNTGLFQLKGQGEWVNQGFNIQKLQQFVDKPSYQEVSLIDFSADTYYSWALSRHFSISRGGYVFALGTKIGNFDATSKSIFVNSLFKPDLVPFFPGWKFV
jgi:hypothetical protein